MVSQALGDAERASYMRGKRILEINPRHPLIQQVKHKFELEPDNAATAALAKILYETALLESGFQVSKCNLQSNRLANREGKGREGKGKGRREKGKEGKGRQGKGREGKGRAGKGSGPMWKPCDITCAGGLGRCVLLCLWESLRLSSSPVN